jgi:hypothetical protein
MITPRNAKLNFLATACMALRADIGESPDRYLARVFRQRHLLA